MHERGEHNFSAKSKSIFPTTYLLGDIVTHRLGRDKILCTFTELARKGDVRYTPTACVLLAYNFNFR